MPQMNHFLGAPPQGNPGVSIGDLLMGVLRGIGGETYKAVQQPAFPAPPPPGASREQLQAAINTPEYRAALESRLMGIGAMSGGLVPFKSRPSYFIDEIHKLAGKNDPRSLARIAALKRGQEAAIDAMYAKSNAGNPPGEVVPLSNFVKKYGEGRIDPSPTAATPRALMPIEHAPAGAEITPPVSTYDAGAQNLKGNIWVRQSASKSNADRTLMVQYSNDLINPPGQGPKSRGDAYFDKLYQSRAGYDRPKDFWEIPQWQASISHNLPGKADTLVIRDPAEAVEFANAAGYKNVAFSALDVNKPMIRDFASQYKGKVIVGGYGDLKPAFKDLPNVEVHPTMKLFIEGEGAKFADGFDYGNFSGTKTVPRLSMSDGCLHKCAFCTVPKQIKEYSKESIMQQADAFAKDLPSSLVYLNDKTFGQAKNHTMLPEVYERIKSQNPDFQGFVIQTTAAQMKKMDPQFMRDAGIKYAELGIESFNDPVLRAAHKPATEAIINSAADKLREAGVSMVPNIMVGLPGETAATYNRTLNWLDRNQDIISHINTTNTVAYEGTELAKTLKGVTANDANQNLVEKSWMGDPSAHIGFREKVLDYGSKQLDKTPAVAKNTFTTIGGGAGMPAEMKTGTGPQLGELLNPPKSIPATPGKYPLDLKKLGKEVKPEDFTAGWITPEGKLIELGAKEHAASIAGAAKGWKYNRNDWMKSASENGLVRMTQPTANYGYAGQQGAAFSLYHHPTDAQLAAMHEMEKQYGTSMWDATNPHVYDSKIEGPGTLTGTGVNQIRRTLEESGFNPVLPPPKSTSELIQPDLMRPGFQPSLMDFLNPPTLTPAFGGYPNGLA